MTVSHGYHLRVVTAWCTVCGHLEKFYWTCIEILSQECGVRALMLLDCGCLASLLCTALECRMVEAGTEATMGLSLWSASVGMTEEHYETFAGSINTSFRVAALPAASDPNGQMAL